MLIIITFIKKLNISKEIKFYKNVFVRLVIFLKLSSIRFGKPYRACKI